MRFALDTNILFYSLDNRDPAKHRIASRIVGHARLLDCVIPAQVLGELVNAVGRRRPEHLALAEELVGLWSLLYDTAATTADQVVAATKLSRSATLQFWDSLIITVAADAGATVLVTEDMQDGATVGGLTLLNPFDPSNRDRLEEVMAAS